MIRIKAASSGQGLLAVEHRELLHTGLGPELGSSRKLYSSKSTVTLEKYD